MPVRARTLPPRARTLPVRAPAVPPIAQRLPPPLRGPALPAAGQALSRLPGPARLLGGAILAAPLVADLAGQLWGLFNGREAETFNQFENVTVPIAGTGPISIDYVDNRSDATITNCPPNEGTSFLGGRRLERNESSSEAVSVRFYRASATAVQTCGDPFSGGTVLVGFDLLNALGQNVGGAAAGVDTIRRGAGAFEQTRSITITSLRRGGVARPFGAGGRSGSFQPTPVPAPAPLTPEQRPAPLPLAPPAPAPLAPPSPGGDPLPQPEPDGEPAPAPLAPPLAPPAPPIAPPGTAPARPGTSPGTAPRPGAVPAPAPPTFPSQDPARPTQPIGPDGRPVPLLPPGPVTTPPGQVIVGPIVIGQPGATPQPTLQGIATEVGKLEQKLDFMLETPPQAPEVDLSPLLEAINDVRATLAAPFPSGQFELFPACDRLPDGSLRPPDVAEWPAGAGPLVELGQKLDALALLIQYHKEQRQPVCRSKPIGEEVTVNFVEVP